ncbi:Biotin carboxyl carrier protein of acetyl-CoA carboxylase [bioreactor metagenome]|uniref:Biotin carboxyl carrier protein of acetyl-CoA carboxylase n=1 Tax=bioreactor metagenome TaxID=1076179 RepID=A0A645FU92_9ZZZZ
MERYDIRQLALLMNETGLTTLEVRDGSFSVRMERGGADAAPAQHSASAPAQAPAPSAEPAQPAAPEEGLHVVTAPMVGVYYASPGPEAKPYVAIGDRVKPGDVLCIIEAMKLMNEITAEGHGVVTEICAGNRQVVEYGHPLFYLRPIEPGTDEVSP